MILISVGELMFSYKILTMTWILLSPSGQLISIFLRFSQLNGLCVSLQVGSPTTTACCSGWSHWEAPTSVRCRISFCILGDRWSKWSNELQPEPKHHSPSDRVVRLLNLAHLSTSLSNTLWRTVRDSDLKLVMFERALRTLQSTWELAKEDSSMQTEAVSNDDTSTKYRFLSGTSFMSKETNFGISITISSKPKQDIERSSVVVTVDLWSLVEENLMMLTKQHISSNSSRLGHPENSFLTNQSSTSKLRSCNLLRYDEVKAFPMVRISPWWTIPKTWTLLLRAWQTHGRIWQ